MKKNQNQKKYEAHIAPTLDKRELLAIVAERCTGAELRNESLYYPAQNLYVMLEFGEMNQVENRFSVQLLFILRHSWFDEDLVESCAGMGYSPDDAMRDGTEGFCAGVLRFVLQTLQTVMQAEAGQIAAGQAEETVTADVMGEEHVFYLPADRPVLHRGKTSSGTDLWEIVRDRIPQYLGKKRCYWVKLYAARTGMTPVCEVRINGTVYPDLTDVLLQEAIKDTSVRMDKQFLLFVQKKETYTACPFEKQDVGELSFMALEKMTGITDAASQRRIFQEIRKACPDSSIAAELLSFLPEICTQKILEIRDNDVLLPVVERGNLEYELRKSQVRSYGYMEDAVGQYLRKRKPSQEEVLHIVQISARFEVLMQALREHVPVEQLRMSQLVYFVDKDYYVW